MAGFELNLQQMAFEFGGGALIGALIGFTAKKVAKLIALLIGLELVLFKFLEGMGIISVDWEALSYGLVSAGNTATDTGGNLLMAVISGLSVGAGFTGGFLVGFKKG